VRRAVFLDRDGTVNEEVSYLDDPDRLRLIPGAAEAIRLLNEAGILAVVISNQAGIGRGYFSAATVEAIHERLAEQLASGDAHLDALYYCPHHPSEGCDCRKPKAGMLVRAAREQGIDMGRAFMVGDKVSDLDAGRRVGCRTVLVLTGYGEQARETLNKCNFRPGYVAINLCDAVKWILTEADAKV
jgi:D-glycero-D-manno-heptose 1,7-bisphosphate phosphatase